MTQIPFALLIGLLSPINDGLASEPEIRWENVEGSPYWIDGAPPKLTLLGANAWLHEVTLEPGATTRLHLPTGSWLRLLSADEPLTTGLEAWVASGPGLAVAVEPEAIDADRRQVFIAPPGSRPYVVLLKRPEGCAQEIRFAAFCSRPAPQRTIQYRDLLPFPSDLEVAEVYRRDGMTRSRFAVLEPRKACRIDVPSGQRLRIETRLIGLLGDPSRNQSYSLEITCGDKPVQIPFVTRADASVPPSRLRVSGGQLLATRNLELDVPAHVSELELVTNARVAFRIRLEDNELWLDDSLPHTQESRSAISSGVVQSPLPRRRIVARNLVMPSWLFQLAATHRSRSDPRSGPILAEALNSLLKDPCLAEDERALARGLTGRATRYVEIHARNKPDVARPLVRLFGVESLEEPHEMLQKRVLHLDDAGIDGALRSLSLGSFVRVPEESEFVLQYPVPANTGPSRLRVTVLDEFKHREATLFVAFDDEPGRPLRTTAPIGEARHRPGLGRAALSLLSHRSELGTPALSAGRAAQVLDKAPFVKTSTADLPLPAGTRWVRVWCQNKSQLRVALHMLRTREPRATERESALHRNRIPREQSALAFWSAYQDLTRSKSAPVTSAMANRWQHWIPLVGDLERWQRSTVTGVSMRAPRSDSFLDDSAVYLARSRGHRLEGEGHWLAAFELWSRATKSTRSHERQEAELRRITALQELGEHGLAEQLMLGAFLHHPDAELRTGVLELRRNLARDPLHPDRVGIAALAAVSGGEPHLFAQLVRALVESGRNRHALEIGLSLPYQNQPVEALALAALREGWRTTLSSLIARMPTSKAFLWRANYAMSDGDLQTTVVNLTHAGELGKIGRDRVLEGHEIRERLESKDIVTRARAILDWERWLLDDPSRRQWGLERGIVVDHDGSFECTLEPGSQQSLYQRTSRIRPLRAEVLGPAELLLEVRPIHSTTVSQLSEGWVQVRINGRLRPIPVTANRPRTGAEISGLDALPGGRVVSAISIGPGLHTIEITPEGFDALARFHRARPERSTTVLPTLTPSRLRAVLAGPRDLTNNTATVFYHRADGTKVGSRLHSFPNLSLDATVQHASLWALDPVLAARIALRLPQQTPTASELAILELLVTSVKDLDSDEIHLALHRLGASSRIWQSPHLIRNVPPTLRDEARLADRDLGGLLQALRTRLEQGIETTEERNRVLAMVVYVGEHEPSLRLAALTLAVKYLDRHARERELLPLRARVPSRWSQIHGTSQSGSWRNVRLEESRAESPRWRARRALLRPVTAQNERVLRGHQQIGFTFETYAPSIIRVDFATEAPLYARSVNLTAMLEVNEAEPIPIKLQASGILRSEVLTLDPGPQHLRAWIENPIIGQCVRVTLHSRVSLTHSNFSGLLADQKPVIEPLRRRYQISTSDDPLRVRVDGPAVLRIDRWIGDRACVDSMVIEDAGVHEIVIPPPTGDEEALYRIFQREFEKSNPSQPRPMIQQGSRALLPPATVDPDALFSARPPISALPLGGQEDGTWSTTSTVRQRSLFGEDPQGRTRLDQHLELALIHRYHSELRESWFETGGLLRTRQRGGPTVGIYHRLRAEPTGWPATIQLAAEAYLQWPEGSRTSTTGTSEHAISGAATVQRVVPINERWTLTPTVGIFTAEMSLDSDSEFREGALDPDVFTDYRRDHRYGGVLSPRLTWRPTLDTRLFVRSTVVTNEQFDADQVRGSFGFTQFFRGAIFRAEYRYARLLEDDDRNTARDRQQIEADLSYELWTNAHSRLEARSALEHNLSNGDTGFFVLFAWHFGNGRGFRDFAPGRLQFRSLRELRVPTSTRGGNR